MSEFGYKIYNHNGKIFRIQLWDIAGQDKSACITKLFCKDSHGAVVASDITKRQYLDEVLKWKSSIDENSKFVDNTDLPMILIENKCDLVDNTDESEGQFKDFCTQNKFINGFRTSSKGGINITESMDFLIKHIIEKLEKIYSSGKQITSTNSDRENNIVLNKDRSQSKNKEKTKCC